MKAEYVFIGVNMAGIVRATSLDDAGCERSNSELVMEWLRMGRSVERIHVSALKDRLATGAPKP